MISLVEFTNKHLLTLIELHVYNKVDYKHLTMKTLPKIGYVSFLGKEMIAAGFLRKVEGGFAQIDTLVSNPAFGSQVRHEGIRLVVDALMYDANKLKLKGIIAFTTDQGVLSRAETYGFKDLNQKVIGKMLT